MKTFRNILIIAIPLIIFSTLFLISLFSKRVTPNPPGTVGNTAGNLNNKGLFCEDEGVVYFANAYDSNTLYSMNPDETNVKKLSNAQVSSINAAGNFLYYYQASSAATNSFSSLFRINGLYRSKKNGKSAVCLKRVPVPSLSLADNTVFYQSYNNKTGTSLCRIDIDKKNYEVIEEYIINPAAVYNGMIYFGGTQKDHYLYGLNTQTNAISTIYNGNVYNPKHKLMSGRSDKGEFDPNFDPAAWSRDFCEGNSWHWSFCVFHDPQGLIDLMGGKKVFTNMMDSVFIIPGHEGLKSRGVIHEMREMQVMDMGQYAHGNQPIQHMVYMYNYGGEPWKAQQHVRDIMDKLYTAAPDGYCGDEDNGQTSAWYVFSALGFYPVCPASDQYVLGTPLFKSVNLHLDNGKTVSIKANNNSSENFYVKNLNVNGRPYSKNYVTHGDLLKGIKMDYTMDSKPNTARGTADSDAPYSFSK